MLEMSSDVLWRYRAEGLGGLVDHSSRPNASPNHHLWTVLVLEPMAFARSNGCPTFQV